MADYLPVPNGKAKDLIFKSNKENRDRFYLVYSPDNGATYYVDGNYRSQRVALKRARQFQKAGNIFSFVMFYSFDTLQWWYIEDIVLAPS